MDQPGASVAHLNGGLHLQKGKFFSVWNTRPGDVCPDGVRAQFAPTHKGLWSNFQECCELVGIKLVA